MEIIAEFGCNWNTGSEVLEMMDCCVDLGIKYIKFQIWKFDQVPKEVQNSYIDEGRAKVFMTEGRKRKLEVFFTPFYPEAVDICERIGVKYYKIRYKDQNNINILYKIQKTGKRVFRSSRDTHRELREERTLLCIPKYPAKKTQYTRYWHGLTYGFDGISDHTKDLELYKFIIIKYPPLEWFEMHVCLDDNAYERKWSKTFKELEAVL